jgi:nucleotide-binding universal stress UspA family protein
VAAQPVQRIVAALDGSGAAERALPLTARLAKLLRVPVHLVTVTYDSGPSDEPPDAYLERTAASFQALDVVTSTEVRSGPVATEIMATLGPGDLLVITTHGQGAARRWQIGNVAEKLLRQAATPVAVVRADTS